MQKIVSIFFLIVFVLVTFQDITLYGLFKMNQEYLTEKFCENKANKTLKCKASCHYKKQVEKAKEAEEKQATLSIRFEIPLFIEDIEPVENTFPILLVHHSKLKFFRSSNTYKSLLKPPQFIV